MFIFTIDQELWICELIDRVMDCHHSLDRKDIFKFVYCLMILFLTVYISKKIIVSIMYSPRECNNIVILNLIIFAWIWINMWIYINIRYFEILKHRAGLSISIWYSHTNYSYFPFVTLVSLAHTSLVVSSAQPEIHKQKGIGCDYDMTSNTFPSAFKKLSKFFQFQMIHFVSQWCSSMWHFGSFIQQVKLVMDKLASMLQ
jgi:hypothetical protein